jgi:hypothetical protein
LTNEAGEIIVFEMFWKQIASENGRVPNDEGGSIFIPRDNIVDGFIFNEVIGFDEKRRRNRSLRL